MSYYSQEQERISDLEKSNAALLEALETSHKRLSQLITDGYSDDDLCLFGQIEPAIAAARGE